VQVLRRTRHLRGVHVTVAAVVTLVTLLTSPGLLDPEGEGKRILRNVGGGMLYMEVKALESFETSIA
jgi:hypothetical protein